MKKGIWVFCFTFCVWMMSIHNLKAQVVSFEKSWLQETDNSVSEQNLNLTEESLTKEKKWIFEAGAGFVTGPYASQLKDVFRSIDLEGCNSFLFKYCYPRDNLAIGFKASLFRKIHRNFSLGLTVHKSYIFGIESALEGDHSTVGSRVLSIAPVLRFSPYKILVLDIGPVYNRMQVRFSNNLSTGIDVTLLETTSFEKMGFMVGTGAIYPPKGRIYGTINIRYIYMGGVEIGPYPCTKLIEFPKSNVDFNQVYTSFGCGIRW